MYAPSASSHTPHFQTESLFFFVYYHFIYIHMYAKIHNFNRLCLFVVYVHMASWLHAYHWIINKETHFWEKLILSFPRPTQFSPSHVVWLMILAVFQSSLSALLEKMLFHSRRSGMLPPIFSLSSLLQCSFCHRCRNGGADASVEAGYPQDLYIFLQIPGFLQSSPFALMRSLLDSSWSLHFSVGIIFKNVGRNHASLAK